MFLVLKFRKSPIDIQWSFFVYIIFLDLLFQLVQIKNKGKLSLKGGMTWIAVTLFLIYCILYYTALYYILSLSMNSISEFLPSTWELRLLSTSSLLSLFLEVLGSDLEPSMLRKCSVPELHPSSFFAAFLARVWGASSGLFSPSLSVISSPWSILQQGSEDGYPSAIDCSACPCSPRPS